jgi:hypothetical protein
MKRLFARGAVLATLMTVFLGFPAIAAHASWVGKHCFHDHIPDSIFKRADARAYANVADGEGYEYAGGCWNNNDQDDTPSQPDSRGEGPDCSGLVFKSWELKPTQGADGGMWWNKWENVHGPYASGAFHSPDPGDPFHRLPDKRRITTVYMDAFARNGHVGLIETNYGPSSGTDYINEARCDACGTDVFVETYRYDGDYVGVRREGWKADCYPRCAWRATASTVIPEP